MAYSCSDFADGVLDCLVTCGALSADAVPADDPEGQANLVLVAIHAMNRSMLASRFVSELLAGVESVGAIADEYGVAVLSLLFYLQAAINNGTVVEVAEAEIGAVALIRTLPSADEWMKYVSIT
jgi:hypothetical protein